MSSAFVVGATGAVGSQLVQLLGESKEFAKVVLLGRKNIETINNDKIIQKTVNFEKLEESSDDIKGFDVGFCALGTTRAKSGADGFYKVDHDYVLNSAKLAKDNGIKHFVLVSSGGANENSFFLYTKTKGQVEKDIKELGFEKFTIMHPGMIETDRDEFRFAETAARILMKPLKLLPISLHTTPIQIAKAMIMATRKGGDGTEILENPRINQEAISFDSNI